MKSLLLDTHAVLWMVLDDPRLSRTARSQIEKIGRLAYSAASLWEIALKMSRGGFDFALPQAWHHDLIRELREIGTVRIEIEPDPLPPSARFAMASQRPFYRMLIAQAQIEELSILTADPRLKKYDVKVLW